MFDYAIKQMKASKAMEDAGIVLDEQDTAVTTNMRSKEASDGAKKFIKSGAIRGLVTAFATRMTLVGMKKEEIAEKIDAFLNDCYHAGDISGEVTRSLKDSDWYQRVPQAKTWRAGSDFSNSMWCLFDDTIEDAMGTRQWGAQWTEDLRKSMTANEKAILENFDKARQAYWEALEIRDNFYRNIVKNMLNGLLVKYASHLEKMDPELFKYMSDIVAPHPVEGDGVAC